MSDAKKTARNYETITTESPAPFVTRVVLNRPEFSNAFNTKMASELYECFEALSLEPRSHRAIILTGAGERAFCAGGDLKERLDMEDADWFSQHLIFERMARAVLNCPIPIIAAVNGAAYGGGCELALAADFIYAAEGAKFALTETRLGLIPGAAGTQTLTRAVGSRLASELILTAQAFGAKDALSWGMVNAVFEPGELAGGALSVAQKIAANAPIATRQAKSAIKRGADLPMEEAVRFEIEAYNRIVTTKDRREGIRAFNEKRDPDFRDE